MPLVKANRFWNYKTFDLTPFQGPDYLEKLGDILDEAGKSGWELVYMNTDFMILKQLFTMEP